MALWARQCGSWGGAGSEEGQAPAGPLSCRAGRRETLFRGAASLASCPVTLPAQTCWRRPVMGDNGTCASGGSCVRHQQTPGTQRCLARSASRPGRGWPAGHGCWQRPGAARRSLRWRSGSPAHGDGQTPSPTWGQCERQAAPGGWEHACARTQTHRHTGAQMSRRACAHPHVLAHTAPVSSTS